MKKFPIVAVLCLIVFVAIAQTIAPFNSNQADTPASTLYGRGATAGSVQALTLGDGLVITNAEVSANVATNVYVQNIYNVGSTATTFKGKITIQTNLVVGLGDGFNGGGFDGAPPIYTQGYHWVDEITYFNNGAAAFLTSVGGVATSTQPQNNTSTVGIFGMWTLATSTGTNSHARLVSGNASDVSVSFGTGGRRMSFLWRMLTPAALSNDGDVYVIGAGAMDGPVYGPTDGVLITYGPHTTSTSFLGVTYSNTSTTVASGGSTLAAVANTWYLFFCTVNAAATSAKFYVSPDEGMNWTYLGESASNIPNGAGRELSFGAGIGKRGGSVGTTSRAVTMDRFEFWIGSTN